MDSDAVWVLVPMTALSIPLMAVIGRVIVKPIVQAIGRLGDAEKGAAAIAAADQRFREVSARLAGIERQLAEVLADPATRKQLEERQQPMLGPGGYEAKLSVPGALPSETRVVDRSMVLK